jgi:hypothetical protein
MKSRLTWAKRMDGGEAAAARPRCRCKKLTWVTVDGHRVKYRVYESPGEAGRRADAKREREYKAG